MLWQEVLAVLQHEFSDLSNINDITRVCVRLLVATILGGILGYEREAVGASAGLRTHMMVSLGAALFVLVPLQTGMAVEDISRVIRNCPRNPWVSSAGT
jgi:putative Mg2+ transporter-C (MgtC) family protein